MIPEFHPAAIAEFEAAVQDGMRFGRFVALRLRNEVARVTELLCDTPDIGEPIKSGYRRHPLSGFPFSLVYRVDDNVLRIVAFMHQRRKPEYWIRRR